MTFALPRDQVIEEDGCSALLTGSVAVAGLVGVPAGA
jgi:hypothetical protein